MHPPSKVKGQNQMYFFFFFLWNKDMNEKMKYKVVIKLWDLVSYFFTYSVFQYWSYLCQLIKNSQ